jgi:hypothetical protein
MVGVGLPSASQDKVTFCFSMAFITIWWVALFPVVNVGGTWINDLKKKKFKKFSNLKTGQKTEKDLFTSYCEKNGSFESVGQSTAVLALVARIDRVDDQLPFVGSRILDRIALVISNPIQV